MTYCAPFVPLAASLLLAGLSAQAQPHEVDLRGAVTDRSDDGQRVRLTLWHDDMSRDTMQMVGERFADEDGGFTFEGVPWFRRQGWGSNQFVLVARTEDRVAVVQLRGDAVDTDDVQVQLRDKVDLRGRLVDATDGEPIEGAWIWPSMLGGMDGVWITEPLLPWRAETDADGRFVLRGLPKGLSVRAIAGGPDHARAWLDLPAHDEPPAELELQPGGRIRGVVRMPDGSPAGRVHVVTSGMSDVGQAYGSTLTDDDGRFELQSLGRGTYKVWAVAPDLTVVAATDLKVEARETIDDVRVQLVEGGFIVGRIVDAATGEPIVPGPRTDVAMYGPARGTGGACECTPVLPDGTFRIRAPAGTNRIYLRAQPDGYGTRMENVHVVEGRETEVTWRLDKAPPAPRGRRGGGIDIGAVDKPGA